MTNVVDVACVLGMSHASLYRHFASKKALLDAVVSVTTRERRAQD